jgi:hypothetical protein
MVSMRFEPVPSPTHQRSALDLYAAIYVELVLFREAAAIGE